MMSFDDPAAIVLSLTQVQHTPTLPALFSSCACISQVETTQVALKEGGVELKLTVVDTPGFGDAVDNSNW